MGQNINNSIKGRDEKQTLDYQGAVWGGRLFQRAMPKDGHLLDAPLIKCRHCLGISMEIAWNSDCHTQRVFCVSALPISSDPLIDVLFL